MEFKNKIEFLLKSLDIKSEQFESAAGLFNGSSGIVLYYFHYNKYFNLNNYDDVLISKLQILAENSISVKIPTLCVGKAGVNWFFSYLYRLGALDKVDWETLCNQDDELVSISLKMLNSFYYDFLHGAIGIAYSILYKKNSDFESFFDIFFDKLLELCNNRNGIFPAFAFQTQQIDFDNTNTSLSHGITSILKFCLQCYKQNTMSIKAKNLAYIIIEYLSTHTNFNKSICYFPNLINNDKFIDSNSRLAWCYGDLSIGFILYQCGVEFNDSKLEFFALDILKSSSHRRTLENTNIYDAGICHGSAGVAYIYYKMWSLTKYKIFKEACDFWIQKTLDLAIWKGGKVTFENYDPMTKEYEENNYGLLTGSAGIGLVLLTYLTGDFSWDYCLMLN